MNLDTLSSDSSGEEIRDAGMSLQSLIVWGKEAIHHICINSLVPSVKKIDIGNPGILLGGGVNPTPPPPLILLVTWISNIGFCVPGNQQINANMVKIL